MTAHGRAAASARRAGALARQARRGGIVAAPGQVAR